MKREYKSPIMYVEVFTVNSAVSTCTAQGGINWTFDCMKGPNIDRGTVVADALASGCDTKVGYAAGITTAYSFYGKSHSDNNSSRATWGKGNYENAADKNYSGNYISVSYTGAEGLLYADASDWGQYTINNWSTTKVPGVVAHSKAEGLRHHMVAPVIDSTTVNASW